MDPLRLGLYGCGARTNALVDSVYGDNLVQVVCCYDVDRNRREETAKKYGAIVVDIAEKLIKNPGVDAFLISLPPKFHARAAIEVTEAGKPIFLEKPIATNLADGKRLVETIRKKGIVCHVGFGYRYIPVFRKVTELIKSGVVGRIIGIQYDWISWIGILYKQIYEEENWRGDPESGGQLIYHYCHLLDLIRVWNGEYTSVTALSNHLIFPKSVSENEIFMVLEHENGALTALHFSEVCKHSTGLGRIEGSELTLEYEWHEQSYIKIYRNARRQGPRVPDEVLEGFDTDASDKEIMEDFIKEARREQPVTVTIEDGFRPLLVAEAARLSAKTGKRIYLSELK